MIEAKQRWEVEILGVLRFVLAVCVVAEHLWPAAFPDVGRHAVTGFFCISGYLITRVRLLSYRKRPGAFLLNRFLRIYPQYLLAVLLGLVVVALLPQPARELNPALQWPANMPDWLRQIFIFGLNGSDVRLSPPTWSLNIELYFYLLIGLLMYPSEKGTYAALALSSVLGLLGLAHVSYIGFYASALGSAFLFFLGSAAYYISQRIALPRRISWVALVVYAGLGFAGPLLLTHHPKFTDYLLVPSAVLVFLVLLKIPVVPVTSRRTVEALNFLGRVSYPLFLIHWAAAVPWYVLIGRQEPAFFLGGLVLSLFMASVMVVVIDRPVEMIRTRIRKSQPNTGLHLSRSTEE